MKRQLLHGGATVTLAATVWVMGCSTPPATITKIGPPANDPAPPTITVPGIHGPAAIAPNPAPPPAVTRPPDVVGIGGGGAPAVAGAAGGGAPGMAGAGGAGADLVASGSSPVFNAGAQGVGAPMPGMTSIQLNEYKQGLNLFSLSWDVGQRPNNEGGFGPLANSNKCSACHNLGGVGGGGDPAIIVTRMAVLLDPGHPLTGADKVVAAGFNNLADLAGPFAIGGPLKQREVTGSLPQETLPTQAQLEAIRTATGHSYQVITSLRQGPPAAGTGLLSAIPNQQILAYAQLNNKPYGIQGRPNLGGPDEAGQPKIGRLGWKAHASNNRDFVADAAVQEIGLSNEDNPFEMRPNAPPVHVGGPGEQPLDLSHIQFMGLINFCNRVAPIQPINQSDPAVMAGRSVFQQTGCAVCHYSGYTTGNAQTVPAAVQGEPELFNQAVPCYSDLLLHHMGEGLADGFVMGQAGGDEWKTTPLWGLRHKIGYLHDGASKTLDEAIRRHQSPGSEANQVVNRYMALSPADQTNLIQFLKTL